VYGAIAKDVKERLATLADRRPVSQCFNYSFHLFISVLQDPYYPPKKHTYAWYLKRSRSIACLSELQPSPDLHYSQNPAASLDEEDVLNDGQLDSLDTDDYSMFLED
jgi:hypothetical protein